MRYIMSIIVAIVLMQMAYYVLANMTDTNYSFAAALIVGAITGILAVLIGESTVSEEDV